MLAGAARDITSDRACAAHLAPVAISVQNVSLTFEGSAGARKILDDISFDIFESEILCLVGPSGCGKTTILRLLAGLLEPSSGSLLCDGEQISGPSRQRAIVFQDYGNALLPWRTVARNIALSLEARGLDREAQAEQIASLLKKMGLEHAAQQYPGQLSGGMQQRVQIARCLAQQPKVLLMDEPFGALDAMTRQALQDELLKLSADQKITIVFITHDLEEAIYLGDRVFVLGANPGRIIEQIDVDLPRPRSQLETREDRRFLAHRHSLFGLLQGH